MCPHSKTWNLIRKPLYHSLNFPQQCSVQCRIPFSVLAQHWCDATFFQNCLAEIKNAVFGKWNGKTNYSKLSIKFVKFIEFVRIATHSETWLRKLAQLVVRSQFSTLGWSFQNKHRWEIDVALSSDDKNKLKEFLL